MIPPFNESGFLPQGVYAATLDEIEDRFGRESEIRRVQMELVRWMVDLAVRAGVRRIVLNGSFVTGIIEPNDVDCVLLIDQAYPKDAAADEELQDGLPFLQVEILQREPFDQLVNTFFSSDRYAQPKGMVEVLL